MAVVYYIYNQQHHIDYSANRSKKYATTSTDLSQRIIIAHAIFIKIRNP
jgi:hypothetical protein